MNEQQVPEDSAADYGQSTDPALLEHVDAKPARPAPARISTTEDLLRYAYAHRGKRLTVPGRVIRQLASESAEFSGGDPLVAVARELSATDPLIAVPPKLLNLLARTKPPAAYRRRILGYVGTSLQQHPLFSGPSMREASERSIDDGSDLFDTVDRACSELHAVEVGPEPTTLSKAKRAQLLANATSSLLLYLAMRDNWPLERAAGILAATLWGRKKSPADSLGMLTTLAESKDGAALVVLKTVFERLIADAERRVLDADEATQRAMARRIEAEEQLVDRDASIATLEGRAAVLEVRAIALSDDLDSEREQREHDRRHHADDLEKLRTRLVRLLDRQVGMLGDGLHALSNGSPSVTEEFLERSIDALTGELKTLRRPTGDDT